MITELLHSKCILIVSYILHYCFNPANPERYRLHVIGFIFIVKRNIDISIYIGHKSRQSFLTITIKNDVNELASLLLEIHVFTQYAKHITIKKPCLIMIVLSQNIALLILFIHKKY